MINEVMYDPAINDNYYEWIELYNPTNQSINLTGWNLTDNSAEDFLEGNSDHGNGTTILPPFSYALITDHGTKFYNNYSVSNNTVKLYIDDSAIGNGLSNSGDKLILKNNQNETVIVESCNWVKTGLPKNPTYGNREWGIIVRNTSVAGYFLNVFLDDWNPNRCDSYSFNDMNLSINHDFYMDKSVYSGSYEPQFEAETFVSNSTVIPVFSPDTSYRAICDMIDSANESIYIEQLYIYKNWADRANPFVERLVNKSKNGIDIKVILNYNPVYEGSNEKNNLTKQYFEENGIEVKFIYTNWSYFSNVHNKGMIVDNKSVLISSINWNENSVINNREAGIIIENEEVARYYANVFFYDWNLNSPKSKSQEIELLSIEEDYKNTIYIVIIFTLTFALVARDWRKRQWT